VRTAGAAAKAMTAGTIAAPATLETKARRVEAVLMIPHSPFGLRPRRMTTRRLEPFNGRALLIASRNRAQPTLQPRRRVNDFDPERRDLFRVR
jgi:hypothetical protein